MQASIEFDQGEYFIQILAESGAEALALSALINGTCNCTAQAGQTRLPSGEQRVVVHFKKPGALPASSLLAGLMPRPAAEDLIK